MLDASYRRDVNLRDGHRRIWLPYVCVHACVCVSVSVRFSLQLTIYVFTVSMLVSILHSSLLVLYSFHNTLVGVLPFVSPLQHINEKPQVIQEYEQGKAVPNQNVLGKIERAIGECRVEAVVGGVNIHSTCTLRCCLKCCTENYLYTQINRKYTDKQKDHSYKDNWLNI